MISDPICDPIADLDAVLAAQLAISPNNPSEALGVVFGPNVPTTFDAEPRPEVVAGAIQKTAPIDQCNKGFGTSRDYTPQCVITTPTITPTSPISQINLSSPVHTIAGRKSREPSTSSSPSTRQPRRAAAKLENVAVTKSWEGRKCKGRKDKLTETEKFSAAIWSVAASNGLAVSLNLGFRREAMLWCVGDPKRRMMQNLHKYLSAAGFGGSAYAFAFEMTSEAKGNRVHLHGAINTSGLTDADIQSLGAALRRAASFASGAIGGERQLDLGPLHNSAGWVDYILKDKARTARELGLDGTVFMNNHMLRQAKVYFEHFRDEVHQRLDNPIASVKKSRASRLKAKQINVQGFTSPPVHAINKLSGERDQTLVGGAHVGELRRPHSSTLRIAPARHRSSHGRCPVRPSTTQRVSMQSRTDADLAMHIGFARSPATFVATMATR